MAAFVFDFVAPANVEEVQKLVVIANEYKIPFWINSTGKNWVNFIPSAASRSK